MVSVFDLTNKLDGTTTLARSKRNEVSGLEVDCMGFCYQTKELKHFCYSKGV